MLSSEYIAIGLAAVTFIVWLVRLEGRVNTGEKTDLANAASAAKADDDLRREIAVVQAAHAAREAKHDQMNENLIRMQEQLKYLTNLFERHFVEPPRRPASTLDPMTILSDGPTHALHSP